MQFSLSEFLFPATPEGKFFNTVILLVFVWGLLQVFKIGAVLAKERKALSHVRAELEKSWAGETENAPHEKVQTLAELRLLAKLAIIDPGPQPATLIGKRLHSLWSVRSAGRGSLEALGTVEETRQFLSLDMPRYFTSILVLLGLAGTIASLRGVISHLNGALAGAATDPSALLQALEPLRSAFSCSLLGIVTSICLALALTRVEQSQSQMMASLEETVTLDIIPLIFPESEEAQLHEMTRALENSQKFLTAFGQTLESSRTFFAETLGTAVRGAAQELQERLSQATSALQSSLNEMRGTAATLSESTQNVVQYRAELERERQELQEFLRESANHLSILSQAVLEPLQVASESLAANNRAIDAVVLRNQDDRDSLRQGTVSVVDGINVLTSAMAEEKRAITEMAEQSLGILTTSASEFSHQISQHALQSQESALILDTLMRQVNPEMLTLPNGKILGRALTDVSEQLEKVDGTLHSMAEQMGERLSYVSTRANETNQQILALVDAVQALTVSNDQQELQQLIRQQLTASNDVARATLQEMRLMRLNMERPVWRTWIGQTNGTGQAHTGGPMNGKSR